MKSAGWFALYTVIVWFLGFTTGVPLGIVLNELFRDWSKRLTAWTFRKLGWEKE